MRAYPPKMIRGTLIIMMITRRLNIKFSTLSASVVRVVGLRAIAVTAVRRIRMMIRVGFEENMAALGMDSFANGTVSSFLRL